MFIIKGILKIFLRLIQVIVIVVIGTPIIILAYLESSGGGEDLFHNKWARIMDRTEKLIYFI